MEDLGQRGEKGWSGVAGRETMELVDFEWRFGGESNDKSEFKHTHTHTHTLAALSEQGGKARGGGGRERGGGEGGVLHGEPKHKLTSVASRLSSTIGINIIILPKSDRLHERGPAGGKDFCAPETGSRGPDVRGPGRSDDR